MSTKKWGCCVTPAQRLDQFKLIYDYIKFHIGLYIATPAFLKVVADADGLSATRPFLVGLLFMLLIYGFAGIHAGLFMSRNLNDPWQNGFLSTIEEEVFSGRRRFAHHMLYWIGLFCGVAGLGVAAVVKYTGSQDFL